jgi:hypothetical protein
MNERGVVAGATVFEADVNIGMVVEREQLV